MLQNSLILAFLSGLCYTYAHGESHIHICMHVHICIRMHIHITLRIKCLELPVQPQCSNSFSITPLCPSAPIKGPSSWACGECSIPHHTQQPWNSCCWLHMYCSGEQLQWAVSSLQHPESCGCHQNIPHLPQLSLLHLPTVTWQYPWCDGPSTAPTGRGSRDNIL